MDNLLENVVNGNTANDEVGIVPVLSVSPCHYIDVTVNQFDVKWLLNIDSIGSAVSCKCYKECEGDLLFVGGVTVPELRLTVSNDEHNIDSVVTVEGRFKLLLEGGNVLDVSLLSGDEIQLDILTPEGERHSYFTLVSEPSLTESERKVAGHYG